MVAKQVRTTDANYNFEIFFSLFMLQVMNIYQAIDPCN